MDEKNAETRGLLSCPRSTRDLRGHLSAGLRRRTGQAGEMEDGVETINN